MRCQRSKSLLNEAERRLLQQLRAAVEDYNADVQAKVRLADALDLKNSGVSDELFSYGIRAHLDFVVVNRDTFQCLFAVEYDGANISRIKKRLNAIARNQKSAVTSILICSE